MLIYLGQFMHYQLLVYYKILFISNMYADFFREDRRRRPSNPTYASSHVISSMVFPILKESPNTHQKIRYQSPKVEEQVQQRNPENHKYESMRKQKSKSNLSNYGSSSLKRLSKLSNYEIIQNQKKKYDIISNNIIRGKESVQLYQGARQREMVSGKITQMPVNSYDEGMYVGISTLEHNMKIEERQKIRSRPKYLNNVHEVQF